MREIYYLYGSEDWQAFLILFTYSFPENYKYVDRDKLEDIPLSVCFINSDIINVNQPQLIKFIISGVILVKISNKLQVGYFSDITTTAFMYFQLHNLSVKTYME